MLQPVLLGITGTSTLVLRRGDIETVAQGELDATGIVVLHFPKHHPMRANHGDRFLIEENQKPVPVVRVVMTWRHSTMLSTSQTLSFLFMSLLFYSPIHGFLSHRR